MRAQRLAVEGHLLPVQHAAHGGHRLAHARQRLRRNGVPCQLPTMAWLEAPRPRMKRPPRELRHRRRPPLRWSPACGCRPATPPGRCARAWSPAPPHRPARRDPDRRSRRSRCSRSRDPRPAATNRGRRRHRRGRGGSGPACRDSSRSFLCGRVDVLARRAVTTTAGHDVPSAVRTSTRHARHPLSLWAGFLHSPAV